MTTQQILDRLNPVFQDIFDDESLTVTEQTTADDVDGWDSLTHITLISAVEDEFGIRFAMKDLVKLKDVGELARLVRKNLKE